MPFSIEPSPLAFTPCPWYLAAWNAMAVDQYANKPKENAKKNPSVDDNDTTEPADVKSPEEQTETIEEWKFWKAANGAHQFENALTNPT